MEAEIDVMILELLWIMCLGTPLLFSSLTETVTACRVQIVYKKNVVVVVVVVVNQYQNENVVCKISIA